VNSRDDGSDCENELLNPKNRALHKVIPMKEKVPRKVRNLFENNSGFGDDGFRKSAILQ
jgi:hypothetical protein